MRSLQPLPAILLAAALYAAPLAAHATPPSAADVVTDATQGAVVVDKTAPGPSRNLLAVIGHVKDNPSRRVVVWLVDGQYVMSGALINVKGVNLSEQMAIQDGLIPKPITGAQAFAIAKPAHSILIGKAGPVLTVFEDPNCSACHAFSTAVLEDIDAGKLRVRVIPVGFLKPDSSARAAAILSAPNPKEAWRSNETTFKTAEEEGGYPIGRPAPAVLAQVQANTQLLYRVNQGRIATPTILYCDKIGAPQIARGWQNGILRNLGAAGCMPH